MNELRHREAQTSDADAIVEFQLSMAMETEGLSLDKETCTLGVRAVFGDASRGRYYVSERNRRVVASVLITYEWSDWRHGVVWWLQSVYVVPEARRQGVYSGLYAHLQGLARADDRVRGIRLYVDGRNTMAQRVYADLGMNGEHYRVFEWMKE